MNIKHKRILALIGVAFIAALTSAPTLKDANAALTAPASWTFKYTNQDFPGYKIRNSTGVISTPAYTRTADGIYYNYTNTSTITTGLNVTQTFNRSNTSWYTSGSTYIPSDTKIGSDNTVGSITNKVYLQFDNQTNKNYSLFLDTSSTTIEHWTFEYDDISNYGRFGGIQIAVSELNRFYIPSYTKTELFRSTTSSITYFDAWYLQDLGVSAAYDAGVDAGYIQGQDDADLLVTGFSAMVGILVNFVLMIANLEVLGVSLMGILTIIILFAGIVWTLKLIRG